MDCKEIQAILPAYTESGLDPVTEERVRTHLGVCAQCSARHAGLLKAWQAMDTWEEAVPPGRLRTKILDSVRPRRKTASLRAVLSVAAALLLVLGLSVYFTGQHGKPVPELATSQLPVQKEADNNVSEEEIIANLDILRDNDFLDALDDLVRIEELPLAEEPNGRAKEPKQSALDMVIT